MDQSTSNFVHLLFVSFSCSYSMQVCNFLLSKLHVVDNFTGLVEFVPAAVYGYAMYNGSFLEDRLSSVLTCCRLMSSVLTGCLLVWSLRLTIFLVIRYWHRPVLDKRLTDISEGRKTGGLLTFWFLHGSWGFVVSLPVTLTNALDANELNENDVKTNVAIAAAGFVIWIVGFSLEAYADFVKLREYKRSKTEKKSDKFYYNMNETCCLWRYSRNPNFCGETLCWVGIAVMATANFSSWSGSLGDLVAISLIWASPAFTLVIMLLEAVKLTELKNNKRFGHLSSYDKYKSGTSVLWVFPPDWYENLPIFVRKTIFFDWNMFKNKSAAK